MADCDEPYLSQDEHLVKSCADTWDRKLEEHNDNPNDPITHSHNDCLWLVVRLLAQRVVELQADINRIDRLGNWYVEKKDNHEE